MDRLYVLTVQIEIINPVLLISGFCDGMIAVNVSLMN